MAPHGGNLRARHFTTINPMETTCPHCAQALELDAETLEFIGNATQFACPTCRGKVPVPSPASAPESECLQVECPTCSAMIEIDAESLGSLRGSSHFDCPACGASVPFPGSHVVPAALPAVEAAETRSVFAAIVSHIRQSNRNLVILGAAALLLLGGLGVFLATRKGQRTIITRHEGKIDVTNNKFFQELIASGATTAADLQPIANIQPMGVTFIGVSRDKLTFEQAQALASRTGSHVLTIEPPKTAMRQPILDAVAAAYPELLGTTSWVMENGEPRVIDGLDVNKATTLARPRTALFNWYPVRNDKDRAWVTIKAVEPKPATAMVIGDTLKAVVEYNNPGPSDVRIWATPRMDGKVVGNPRTRDTKTYAAGKGEAEVTFLCIDAVAADELRIEMREVAKGETVATMLLPISMIWGWDPRFEIEIISVKPPATLTPAKEITIPATAGQKFTLGVTARYKAPEPTKLASNLLLKDANILPPEFIQDLSAQHSATWHFDTESRPGYASVNGEGEITFDLIGYAPRVKGDYTFNTNIGLFDKQSWATKVLKLYPTTIVATDRAPAANPPAR